jgi:hypothetical protein
LDRWRKRAGKKKEKKRNVDSSGKSRQQICERDTVQTALMVKVFFLFFFYYFLQRTKRKKKEKK